MGQSTARSLRVQSQQLPMESQVFEDEVRPATERTDQPAEEMSERHDHGKNFSGKDRIKPCAKSFISQVYDLLARHKHPFRLSSETGADIRAPEVRSIPCALAMNGWRGTSRRSLLDRPLGEASRLVGLEVAACTANPRFSVFTDFLYEFRQIDTNCVSTTIRWQWPWSIA